MPWGRLDDGLYDHPKLDALGRSKLPAVGLWTLSISWSNRRLTDGFVPADRIRALGGTKAIAELLADVGLFDRVEGGYAIHDFLTFNDSAETVQARRDAAAERQRRHRSVTDEVTPPSQRDSRRDKGVSHSTHARASALASRPGPSESRPTAPQPPSTAGGRKSRANGTSPRQVAAEATTQATDDAKGRRWRSSQRQLAYHRGAITEAQRTEMDGRDAPLEEIPDWVAHLTALRAPEAPSFLEQKPKVPA